MNHTITSDLTSRCAGMYVHLWALRGDGVGDGSRDLGVKGE